MSQNGRDVVNQNEWRVVGMSRSGNHAIIQWIRAQATGRTCFLNCVEPKTNPFVTARELGTGERALVNYDEFCLEQEQRGEFSNKDLLLYSYEDCFLGMVTGKQFEENHDRFVGRSARRVDLLVLRDPLNLFASRLRSEYTGVTRRTAVRIWKQHARQFLGERTYFTQPFVPVSYNRWVCDRGYRREIAQQLGLQFTDARFGDVPKTGGGSSFDGRRFHGDATRMDIMTRWQHFEEDREYLDLFDDDVLRLNHEIFGEIASSDRYRRLLERMRKRAAADKS